MKDKVNFGSTDIRFRNDTEVAAEEVVTDNMAAVVKEMDNIEDNQIGKEKAEVEDMKTTEGDGGYRAVREGFERRGDGGGGQGGCGRGVGRGGGGQVGPGGAGKEDVDKEATDDVEVEAELVQANPDLEEEEVVVEVTEDTVKVVMGADKVREVVMGADKVREEAGV